MEAELGCFCIEIEEHLYPVFSPMVEKLLFLFAGKIKINSHRGPRLKFHLEETRFNFPCDTESLYSKVRIYLIRALLFPGRMWILHVGF